MNEKFNNICKMTQKKVKDYVAKELANTHKEIYVGDGYVYAQGTFPVLLLAHMDTVHKALPKAIFYEEETNSVFSPNGIGGDDRCGIYMVLEIVKTYNCSVLFCEDEEIGGVGARKFIKTDLAKSLKFNYAIEFDRKGSKDAVFYDCDNDDFEEFITKEFYKTAFGSFSDISVVAPALGCAAVNLSCGYYNAHTKDEYVVLNEMERSIEEACKILDRTTEKDVFEYIEAKHFDRYSYGGYNYGNYNYGGYSYYGGYDYYGHDTLENYYIIEYTNKKGHSEWVEMYAVSEAEAVGKFLMWNPSFRYQDITDIMVEKTRY